MVLAPATDPNSSSAETFGTSASASTNPPPNSNGVLGNFSRAVKIENIKAERARDRPCPCPPDRDRVREAAWKNAIEESEKAGNPYEGEDGKKVVPATHQKGLLEEAIDIYERMKQSTSTT